jgi:hypothetical protein
MQRGMPTWGDRPQSADDALESRWRSQPAIVNRPENSSLRRSKDGSHSICSKIVCRVWQLKGSYALDATPHCKDQWWPFCSTFENTHGRFACAGIFLVAFLAQISGAEGSALCGHIDQLQAVSDSQNGKNISAQIKERLGSDAIKIVKMNDYLFLVTPTNERCADYSCYHTIVRLLNEKIEELFSFRSSGRFVFNTGDIDQYVDQLGDHYSVLYFATAENFYLKVGLPRTGRRVLAEPVSRESAHLPTCRTN